MKTNPYNFKRNAARAIAYYLLFSATMTIIPMDTFAQLGGPLKGLQKEVMTDANVIFWIGVVVGLLMAVIEFFSNHPNKWERIKNIVVGLFIWFGFFLIIDFIKSTTGGSGGINGVNTN